jgi:hypothetical protein
LLRGAGESKALKGDFESKPMAESKHELASIEITPAENGGHTIKHRFKSKPVMRKGAMHSGMEMGYQEPEEHVFGKGQGKEVMAHIGKHLGIGAPAKAQTDEAGG